MRTVLRLAVFVASLSALAMPRLASAADDDKDWLDQAILLKETARPYVNEKRVSWMNIQLPGVVREVKDDWLNLGGETWVTKDEALRIDDAPAYFTTVIKKQPNSPVGYLLRGVSWQLKCEYQNALKDFEAANRLAPENSSIILCRGKAHYLLHHYDDALADFTEAIRIEPTNMVAYNDRGVALNAKGEFEKAISQYNEILRKDPKNALAYSNRGTTRCDMGQVDEGLADLDEAIKLSPKMSQSYCNRGKARLRKGDYPDAMSDFDKALELSPHEWPGYYGEAYIRATSPWAQLRDGKKAKELALKACELSHWTEWLPISTLAAACAELDDYEAAVRWQTKAMEMMPKGKIKVIKDAEKRLALYKDGKPFYDEPDAVTKPAEGVDAPKKATDNDSK